MQNLEKRITELEKGALMGEGPLTIVLRFLTPSDLDKEILELHDQTGRQQWTRQPGETEKELIDRATCEVERNESGCALLIMGE